MMKPETREKMRQAKLREWAAKGPEERAEFKERAFISQRRAMQLRRIRHNALLSPVSVSSFALDPDFDED